MSAKYTQSVLAEIDLLITNQDGIDVFNLPQDVGDLTGEVEPIFTTWTGGNSVFLLKISPNQGMTQFINLYTGDGGIFIHRSNVSNAPDELMFETEEGWSEF